MIVGTEWLVEAVGCNAALLRNEATMRDLFDRIIDDLGLKAINAIWHRFPGEGGITGLVALTESHLACHTYPEHGSATFNLYCCRTRPAWDWETDLMATLEAVSVSVTKLERGGISGHESEISNLKSEISNPESEISNLKSEISNPEFEISNPKSKIQNPKSKMAGGDA